MGPLRQSTESSMPGMKATPTSRAATAASVVPSSVSWSVSANAVSPVSAAARAMSAGRSLPSEKRLWVWRSTAISG